MRSVKALARLYDSTELSESSMLANAISIEVRKTARIRNRYNQVPHLSQDTKWESNNIRINPRDQLFPFR